MSVQDGQRSADWPGPTASPFTRSDDAAGHPYELAKLVLLGLTLAPARLILWLGLVLPLYGLCRLLRAHHAPLPCPSPCPSPCPCPCLPTPTPAETPASADCLGAPLAWVRAVGRFMARLTLVLVGFWPCIGIRRTGLGGRSPAQWASGSVLILCNHLSWLDILFLMSEGYSPSFVAKSGFLQAPMVGWFAVTLFDCVPVTSKEPEASGAEAGGESPRLQGGGATAAITIRLQRLLDERRGGRPAPPLVTFCEGTTSNGQFLIDFRTGVFRAAASAMQLGDAQAAQVERDGVSPAAEGLEAPLEGAPHPPQTPIRLRVWAV